LVAAQQAAEEHLAKLLPRLAVELTPPTSLARRRPTPRLSIAASHDLALAALRDALPAAAGLSIDVAFVGSLQALEQFAAGRVQLGGFHVAASAGDAADLAPFRRLLHTHRDRLIRVVDRDQGFILPRGNPARVRSFADVARERLRFVNRQRGSGTRVLIDRLLADEGVDPGVLLGYANEEFTHAAVAATVACGAADAGFGLRAAAAEHGLAFVPRLREHYYLAVRAKALATPEVGILLETLRGAAFGRIAGRLPGYQRAGAGTVLAIDALGS
jgi:putative molybdopterin biosynthesis protein